MAHVIIKTLQDETAQEGQVGMLCDCPLGKSGTVSGCAVQDNLVLLVTKGCQEVSFGLLEMVSPQFQVGL